MDKKITRRAVLGTVVGGLAVAPFLIHRWRKESLEDMLLGLHYAPFKVEGTEFLADVSPEQVRDAFAILFSEREAWLSFRKFSGHVTMSQENSNEKVEALLTFEWLPPKGDFPGMGKFTCKDPASKKQLWVYSMERGNKNPFTGEDVKKELIPSLVAMVCPLVAFYSLNNNHLDEMFRTHFKVSLNPEAKEEAGAYAFRPIDSEADRAAFLARNGRVYAIQSQHQGSPVGMWWEGFDWKSFGKLHFPSVIKVSEQVYEEGVTFERKLLTERRLLTTHVFEDFIVS